MVKPAEPGICRCIKCRWRFVSPDHTRVRKCYDCQQHEEPYSPLEEASMENATAAIRRHFERYD